MLPERGLGLRVRDLIRVLLRLFDLLLLAPIGDLNSLFIEGESLRIDGGVFVWERFFNGDLDLDRDREIERVLPRECDLLLERLGRLRLRLSCSSRSRKCLSNAS